ncbi:MAG: SufD family Fe-S cluster assembly protein [Nitrososphaerota archaeon]|nr:SufD family Fe-S cluster assembly protein [Candidatus Bathyarchaeota archaeon]MDW8048184.1 SufD family Fe-S cluster assembly protein [Nitrososphaerota archaeon]
MSKDKEDVSRERDKPAKLGLDLDIQKFSRQGREWTPCPVSKLPREIIERALEVGVVPSEGSRSATYFQLDHSVISRAVSKIFEDKIEMLSTREALKKYDWFRDYWWKLIPADMDKYTSLANLNWDQGYFIRILEDQKVTIPLQACIYISTDNLNQNVHNVIIAEPGSEAQIITGCTVHKNVRRGLHVGITEFYIKEDAKVTFTMIHNWAQEFDSRPRSAAALEENASFVSNYMCFKPLRSIQMYPVAYCRGANSRVSFNSIIYGSGDSYIDVGAKVVLQNEKCRGEVITRAIASDNSQIYSRGFLQGEHDDCKAHLECRGLLLSDKAVIYAVPELLAKAPGAELSHEAAVGKIAEEQILYLMARGFTEEEAEALIVRGFMDVSIFGLPKELEADIQRIVDATTKRAL